MYLVEEVLPWIVFASGLAAGGFLIAVIVGRLVVNSLVYGLDRAIASMGIEQYVLWIVAPLINALGAAGVAVGLEHTVSGYIDHTSATVGQVMLAVSAALLVVGGYGLSRMLRMKELATSARVFAALQDPGQIPDGLNGVRTELRSLTHEARPARRWQLVLIGVAELGALCVLPYHTDWSLRGSVLVAVLCLLWPILFLLWRLERRATKRVLGEKLKGWERTLLAAQANLPADPPITIVDGHGWSGVLDAVCQVILSYQKKR